MIVKNCSNSSVSLEHEGQVKVWHLLEECKTVDHVEEVMVEKELKPHRSSVPAEEFYYIIKGRGVMYIDGEEKEVFPGDLVYIPPGALHGIKVLGDSVLHFLSWKVLLK
ncbi:MAG: cupin domain-containing protein [Nitrososphaeria archaeon]